MHALRTGTASPFSLALAAIAPLALAAAAAAQQTVTYETDPNTGVTFQVTRNVTQQLAPVTEMQKREETVYTPRVSTQMQTYQQNTVTPVTEYRWVSRMRGRWNPFVRPYWAQQLEPFTRWESRQTTYQSPTTKTDWVPEKRVVQTPVTTYRTVQNETVSRVAVGGPAAGFGQPGLNASPQQFAPVQAPMVASRTATAGGTRMTSDPPRSATGWRSSGTMLR